MNASISAPFEASLEGPVSVAKLTRSAWCCALLLSEVSPSRRPQFLDNLLDRILEAEPELRRWGLVELAHYVEEMSPASQVRFMAAYSSDACADGCGCSAIDSDEAKSRLERRVAAQEHVSLARRSTPGQRIVVAREQAKALRAISGKSDPEGMPTIALVVPEFLSANTFLQPPLEMLLAAARLRHAGYPVRLVDNRVEQLPFDLLEAKIAGAEIIAVTTTPYDHIQNYFLDYRLRYSFQTISFLKLRFPDSVVIACGAHGTVRPDIVFNESLADIVLKGEFDTELLPVVTSIHAKADLRLLSNIAIRGQESMAPDGHGGVFPYQLVQLGDQFRSNRTQDDWVMPAYDLVDLNDYYGDVYVQNRLSPQKRCATTLATRGCAHDCSFCFNFWGRRVRYRNPESIVEEMQRLEHEWRANHLFFLDFHFSQNPAWVARLCELIRQKNLHITWSAQARCDALPLTLLEDMAASRCAHLWLGVESFDEQVIARSRKYSDSEPAIQAIANCRKAGIQPHLFVMIGLPGETRQSINATMAQMHAAKASYCGVMVATPRFGTPYYELAKSQFPQLGNDFYGLRAVRGLVANELEPRDLQEALTVFEQRDFIYRSDPPQMTVGGYRQ